MKVALVYDRINRWGGAERIITALMEIYPDAPIFTFVYEPHLAGWASGFDIRTSFWQKFPLIRKRHEWFPVLPIFAFEKFNFRGFDLVISVTSGEAKGIITPDDVRHICICLTPTRYLWSHYREYFSNKFLKTISLPLVSALRIWDAVAAQRPDVMLAISQTVKRRIRKYYRRDAEVIYPPVDTENFYPAQKPQHDYFLIVGRLVKYKRFDLAVAACRKLNLALKVVGQGPQLNYLKKIAGEKTEFISYLTDNELRAYYQNCTAFLFPQAEDFGISAVEALACGKPVIGYDRGAAGEFITPGKTGELFSRQSVEGMTDILGDFDYNKYLVQNCRVQAEEFSKDRFKKEMRRIVEKFNS